MANQHMDVSDVARLARIELSPEETTQFQDQLESILTHIDQLSQVDVEGIDVEKNLPFGPIREDISRPGIGQDAVIANAPDSAQGQIRVPKVVDPS